MELTSEKNIQMIYGTTRGFSAMAELLVFPFSVRSVQAESSVDCFANRFIVGRRNCVFWSGGDTEQGWCPVRRRVSTKHDEHGEQRRVLAFRGHRRLRTYRQQRQLHQPGILIIAVIIPVFMVLSSWQSHCKSSPGSSDECRTAPGGR